MADRGASPQTVPPNDAAAQAALASTDVLRPSSGGFFKNLLIRLMPTGFKLMRKYWPIARFRGNVIVTRYDDVVEVFENDRDFAVIYKEPLDVIMGNVPFFLSMGDTPTYHAGRNAWLRVVRPEDLPTRLAPQAEKLAETVVERAGGKLEVVDELVRHVTFELLGDYFGVTKPPNGDLRVWATRLFEFQFVDHKSKDIITAVNAIAPALRGHIDNEIARRKASPDQKDDVLGRCLKLQAEGVPGYSDVEIRTGLMGFIVGGPPQPPMVVPQAMEQLLRRPDALAGAQKAARDGNDAMLYNYVREAMRFDPIGPGMFRRPVVDATVAAGTQRATKVAQGTKVLAAFASAMMDGTVVKDPDKFNPFRPDSDYIHFGHALHQCFGIHINKCTLHLMLKPLLKRQNLRRAREGGHLRKIGPFAAELHVEYD